MMTSIVYVGVLVGGLFSGVMADVFGRKLPILVALAGLALTAILNVILWDYKAMLVLRTFFGVFYGLGGPAWTTMACEITPAKWRMTVAGTGQVFFHLGVLFAVFLLWLNTMHGDISWRTQMLLSTIPALVCFVLSLFFLWESPAFLAMDGRHDEAKFVLESMRAMNKQPHVDIEYRSAAMGGRQQLSTCRAVIRQFQDIFSAKFLSTICMFSYLYAVLNFVFYGNVYAFPQVFHYMGGTVSNLKPVEILMIQVLIASLPGVIFGLVVGSRLPRKACIFVSMLLMALGNIIFALGIENRSAPMVLGMALFGGWTLKFFVNFAFVVVWQFTAESFPTHLRGTGCAIAFSAGRLGAIVAPALFEELLTVTGNTREYFLVICTLICLSGILPLPFWPETKDRSLEHLEDWEEQQEKMALRP